MTEAEQILSLKEILPTSLGADEIRSQVAADILARSVFSARMAAAPYLRTVRDVCADLVAGRIAEAEARTRLLSALEAMGHSPQDGGGLSNPASLRRLSLIVNTQADIAASAARLMGETAATVADFPAWELARFEGRAVPREDWPRRWSAAGQAVGWQGARPIGPDGRMVALKSSPIWAALGRGAGGFRDTLLNPYPPFAYSSGLDWLEVSADEARALGLDVSAARVPAAPSLKPPEEAA